MPRIVHWCKDVNHLKVRHQRSTSNFEVYHIDIFCQDPECPYYHDKKEDVERHYHVTLMDKEKNASAISSPRPQVPLSP